MSRYLLCFILACTVLIGGCKDSSHGPSYGDFLKRLSEARETPETKNCGDVRLDRDLKSFNCCLAGEISQGLPVIGSVRDKDKSYGQGYVVRANKTGQAIVYFRFTADLPNFDPYGEPNGTQHFDQRDIDHAQCPEWQLQSDACDEADQIALTCPELSDFK